MPKKDKSKFEKPSKTSKTRKGTKPNISKKIGKYRGRPSRFYNAETKQWEQNKSIK